MGNWWTLSANHCKVGRVVVPIKLFIGQPGGLGVKEPTLIAAGPLVDHRPRPPPLRIVARSPYIVGLRENTSVRTFT